MVSLRPDITLKVTALSRGSSHGARSLGAGPIQHGGQEQRNMRDTHEPTRRTTQRIRQSTARPEENPSRALWVLAFVDLRVESRNKMLMLTN